MRLRRAGSCRPGNIETAARQHETKSRARRFYPASQALPPHDPEGLPMDNYAFEEPVAVIVGLGFVREVGDAMQAFTFLNEWQPFASKKASHAMALKACKAALCGEVDAETARSVFAEFARSNHLLAPEMKPAVISALPKEAGLAGV
jgi:hypothetical protein